MKFADKVKECCILWHASGNGEEIPIRVFRWQSDIWYRSEVCLIPQHTSDLMPRVNKKIGIGLCANLAKVHRLTHFLLSKILLKIILKTFKRRENIKNSARSLISTVGLPVCPLLMYGFLRALPLLPHPVHCINMQSVYVFVLSLTPAWERIINQAADSSTASCCCVLARASGDVYAAYERCISSVHSAGMHRGGRGGRNIFITATTVSDHRHFTFTSKPEVTGNSQKRQISCCVHSVIRCRAVNNQYHVHNQWPLLIITIKLRRTNDHFCRWYTSIHNLSLYKYECHHHCILSEQFKKYNDSYRNYSQTLSLTFKFKFKLMLSASLTGL